MYACAAVAAASGSVHRSALVIDAVPRSKEVDGKDDSGLALAWELGLSLPRLDIDDKIHAHDLDGMLHLIAKRVARGSRYYWIEFWGHGGAGRFSIGDRSYSADDFVDACRRLGITKRHFTDYGRFSGRCPLIWFRTCSTAQGASGESFMRKIADELGVTVYAYQEKIGMNQEGLCRLRPGHAIERDIGSTGWYNTTPWGRGDF